MGSDVGEWVGVLSGWWVGGGGWVGSWGGSDSSRVVWVILSSIGCGEGMSWWF